VNEMTELGNGVFPWVLALVFPAVGLLFTIFMVWLAWRAVRALERIAASVERGP
jgi:hypothetical protein